MSIKKLTVLTGFLASFMGPTAFASDIPKRHDSFCHQIKDCVSKVGDLTGVEYTTSEDLKGNVYDLTGIEVTRDNAGELLAQLLFDLGYTRLPVDESRYHIISSREVRYHALPLINGNEGKVPKSFDYVMVSYQLENPERSSDITRSFRPFMSRYGRIIDVKHVGKIIIQDTGHNINRLMKVLKEMDVPISKEERERRQVKSEHHKRLEVLRAKNCQEDSKKS